MRQVNDLQMDFAKIGTRVKEAREKVNMTQKDLRTAFR